jgi:hypothetical protein
MAIPLLAGAIALGVSRVIDFNRCASLTGCALLIAMAGYLIQRHEYKLVEDAEKRNEEAKVERHRQERESERNRLLEIEARDREVFLNACVPCEGHGCASQARTFPRRQLWRLNPGYGGWAVCNDCFKIYLRRRPIDGHDPRAF